MISTAVYYVIGYIIIGCFVFGLHVKPLMKQDVEGFRYLIALMLMIVLWPFLGMITVGELVYELVYNIFFGDD